MAPELIEFRASPIHGRGGFAVTEIAAGTRVIEYAGERIDKLSSRERCIRGNHAIFHLDEEWDLDGDVEGNPARWLNHSCAPNCQAELKEGRIWITAQRGLRAGEEVTFDYGYDLRDCRRHPCHCGTPDCVGFIVAEELRSQVRLKTGSQTESSA